MSARTRSHYLFAAAGVFVGLPVLFWALGDFPRRSVLKESLSLLFLLAFSLTLGLMLLTRGSDSAVRNLAPGPLINYHKIVGYTCVSVLLLHPVLLVVPRYFEAGITPAEALVTIIFTTGNPGIIAGILGWCLMLLLGITALLRRKLPLRYTTWRVLHGILACVFIIVAAWHVIALGRHADTALRVFIIVLVATGVLQVVRTYVVNTEKGQEADDCQPATQPN